jgi:hypothetical protein
LWRTEVDNQPGNLAQTLGPLAAARADLQVVMGYRLPNNHARAAIEVFPVTGDRAKAAAQSVGLHEAAISAVQVDGDNRPGLAYVIARALADAGINLDFFVGQVSGGRQTTVIAFDSREDADRAIPLIKTAAAGPRKPAARKVARKSVRRTSKKARKATRRR